VDPAALSVAAGTPLAEGIVGLFDNAFTFLKPATEGPQGSRRPLEITKVRGSQVQQTAVDVQLAVSDSRPSGA